MASNYGYQSLNDQQETDLTEGKDSNTILLETRESLLQSTAWPQELTPEPDEVIREEPASLSKKTRRTHGSILQRLNRYDWDGSWSWEVASLIFSVICIALLIAFLAYVNGRVYEDWQYRASPNAITSLIVTIAKSAMLISVSSSISQLKWNYTQSSKPIPLYHMQVLDQASCGPWEAFEVFWRLKPGLATIGAILTVVSIAIDPFAQQILNYPSNQMQVSNSTAFAQSSHEWIPSQIIPAA